MDMTMENTSKQKCKNVFAHGDEELSEAFTSLWIQIINKKETESQVNIANADVLDL
ncbi:MAG: hypothetical protein K2K74_10475 [Lachnospiraceae bacterium]|nr:hypothetical protein [Lachnospiraceae bacterium]